MSSDDHQRGLRKGQFCAIAPDGGKCECGNDYRHNGKAPEAWGSAGVRYESAEGNEAVKRFEVHHILSVAPVSAILLGATSIDAIVRNTKWCINAKDNLVAMPLMAHTVDWYELQGQAEAPPFANLPQHDWGHMAYLNELKEKLGALVKAVEDKSAKHETAAKNIEEDMGTLNRHFRGELLDVRGKRKEGTHSAYRHGACEPFSMASDAHIQTRPFPAGKLSDKVKAWKQRILGAST